MKLNYISKVILSIILLGAIAFAKEYKIDTAHSQVEFKVKHLAVSNVKGSFNEFNGQFAMDKNKLISLTGEVNVDSINTNNKTRDEHIKDKEYFDVKKFPKATIKLVNADEGSGIFDLTIKGITKQVKLNVEVLGIGKNQAGGEVIGMELSGAINRKDFDISKSTPNAIISDNVNITIDIEGSVK